MEGTAVNCSFSVEHYRELLAAAEVGGYRYAFFDHDPQPGDLLLRHDVICRSTPLSTSPSWRRRPARPLPTS